MRPAIQSVLRVSVDDPAALLEVLVAAGGTISYPVADVIVGDVNLGPCGSVTIAGRRLIVRPTLPPGGVSLEVAHAHVRLLGELSEREADPAPEARPIGAEFSIEREPPPPAAQLDAIAAMRKRLLACPCDVEESRAWHEQVRADAATGQPFSSHARSLLATSRAWPHGASKLIGECLCGSSLVFPAPAAAAAVAVAAAPG